MPAMPTDLEWKPNSKGWCFEMMYVEESPDWYGFGELLLGDLVESIRASRKYTQDGLED